MKSKSMIKRQEAMEIADDDGKEVVIEKNSSLETGYVSKCCGAFVRVIGPARDFIGDEHPMIGTCWYQCSSCLKPCNLKVPIVKSMRLVKVRRK